MTKEKVFSYDKEKHEYWLDNERMPSVSEIIKPVSNYDKVPPTKLANSAEFGRAVHLAIELWLIDNLDEKTLDPALEMPLDGFINYYQDFKQKYGMPIKIEEPTYHKKLLYGGTPDLVFEEAIVDIKTRTFSRVLDTLQLAAYDKLHEEFPPKKLYVLEININGDTKLVDASDKQAWGMFRKLLDNYRNNREILGLIKNWKER